MSELNIYCTTCHRHIGMSLWPDAKDIQFFCAVCQEHFDELPSCERECCDSVEAMT